MEHHIINITNQSASFKHSDWTHTIVWISHTPRFHVVSDNIHVARDGSWAPGMCDEYVYDSPVFLHKGRREFQCAGYTWYSVS